MDSARTSVLPDADAHRVRDTVLTVVTAVIGLGAAVVSVVGVRLLTGW